jgi:hypothetical protein
MTTSRAPLEEEYARGNSSGIWRHLCVRQHCDQSGSGDWTFATHDRFLDGFYVIGPTKLFVFRASYGDADPKRLTDVKVRLFPVAASGGEAGADDDSQHSEEVLLTWSRDPKWGFYVEYSLLYPPIGTFIEIDWAHER